MRKVFVAEKAIINGNNTVTYKIVNATDAIRPMAKFLVQSRFVPGYTENEICAKFRGRGNKPFETHQEIFRNIRITCWNQES